MTSSDTSSAQITNVCQKRLMREYELYLKEDPDQSIRIRADPSSILTAYFVFNNIPKEATLKPQEGAFSGGYYLGTVTVLPTYPYAPPVFRLLTPSGRFKPNEPICFSYSHYHKEQWSPELRISSCLIGLLSFMCDFTKEATGNTGGISDVSLTDKITFAQQSLEYNLKNYPMFKTLFPEFCTPKTPTQELAPAPMDTTK